MISSLYLINGRVQKHAKTYDFDFEFIKNSFKKASELYKKLNSDLLKVYFFCESGEQITKNCANFINKKDDEYIPVK